MEHHQPVPAVKAKNSKNVIQKGTGGVMGEHELFKTTIMGGFDKEDVLEQVQRMKDEAASEQLRLKKLISEKDAKIAELMKRIELKDAHQERLEMEIHEKYQKYIDNYESIGKLVFDAQLKSDAMIKEAEEKCNTMISDAEAEAKQRVEAVQSEIDDKLREGKKKYIAVQDEMNEIVQLINQAQKRFMASYKEVHQIISTMPTSLNDIEEEPDVELPPPAEEAEELHLGDTQELDLLDALDDIAELEELEEDEDSKIAMQISKLLSEEDEALLEEELENER